MKRLLFETDWLASQPVFYNEKTGRASRNVNEVIDWANLELHPDGCKTYLDFGYSALEQTPVKEVKFLRHSSRLWSDEHGKLNIEYLDDPVERWLDYRLSETDIIDSIQERIRAWERSVEGEIVIPTSGGYDSRLLNWCLKDKSRIRSFTYGISEKQSDSFEVVYARRLSEILGTRWEQIPLGDFLLYLDEWSGLFGVSTHAHGMYHMEFYSKILHKVDAGAPLLSGIIGDVWAGNTRFPALRSAIDVKHLGHSHGIRIDSSLSAFHGENILLSNYWEQRKKALEDPRVCVIESMRFKLILLCYLKIVPQSLGFRWWSPFLDIKVAMAMVNLPLKRKQNRVWQKDFFQKTGLALESMHLKATRQNTLDMQALRRFPVPPLDRSLLQEAIKPGYVEHINRDLRNIPYSTMDKMYNTVTQKPTINRLVRNIGLPSMYDRRLEAYNAYMILLPIQHVLRKRNQQ